MTADQVLARHLEHLERANDVRLKRAALRKALKFGEVLAADVLLALPVCAETWAIGELLGSQDRWGPSRTRKLLFAQVIGENRPAGLLTDRQRCLLSEALR